MSAGPAGRDGYSGPQAPGARVFVEATIAGGGFKCTTSPIVREPYGVVGAICMNIDVNYIRDHVLASRESTEEFFRRYCATDMQLDENILSRPEYEKALAGKRHWRDEPLAGRAP